MYIISVFGYDYGGYVVGVNGIVDGKDVRVNV